MKVSNPHRQHCFVVTALCTAACLAGCGGRPGPGMAVARMAHRLTAGSDLESTVALGEEISADLPFSSGTGYAWTAKGYDEKILMLKSQEARSDANDGRTGRPMIEHFVFEGIAIGETTIEFELRRPWEKEIAPSETRKMRVKITAPSQD
jgi:predicted secreted protein